MIIYISVVARTSWPCWLSFLIWTQHISTCEVLLSPDTVFVYQYHILKGALCCSLQAKDVIDRIHQHQWLKISRYIWIQHLIIHTVSVLYFYEDYRQHLKGPKTFRSVNKSFNMLQMVKDFICLINVLINEYLICYHYILTTKNYFQVIIIILPVSTFSLYVSTKNSGQSQLKL